MGKNIWHTADEAPKPYEDIAFYVDGYLYSSYYEHNQYGIFGADKIEKWCYAKELSSYILALETELERTRKALEIALDWLEQVATLEKCDDDLCREFTKRKLVEIKKALEQKD